MLEGKEDQHVPKEETFTVASSSSDEDEEGKTAPQPKRYNNYNDEDRYRSIEYRPINPRKFNFPVRDSLSWILFYTDIEHSVSPVTEGIRMVLQFDVYERSTSVADEQTVKKSINGYVIEEEEADEYNDSGCTIFQLSKPVEADELIIANSEVFAPIISILQKELTSMHALAIPLYYLYTSESILKLKNIDKELFQSLLAAGFPVALIPIELVTTTDNDGHHLKGRKNVLIRDFPFPVYEQGSAPSTTRVKTMTEIPGDFKVTYVVTGLEATTLLDARHRVEHTGNDSAPGKYRYLCGLQTKQKIVQDIKQ
jgi:hypothetical protein